MASTCQKFLMKRSWFRLIKLSSVLSSCLLQPMVSHIHECGGAIPLRNGNPNEGRVLCPSTLLHKLRICYSNSLFSLFVEKNAVSLKFDAAETYTNLLIWRETALFGTNFLYKLLVCESKSRGISQRTFLPGDGLYGKSRGRALDLEKFVFDGVHNIHGSDVRGSWKQRG